MERGDWSRWMGRIAGLLACVLALSFVLHTEGDGTAVPGKTGTPGGNTGILLSKSSDVEEGDPEDDPLYVRMMDNGLEDEAVQESGATAMALSTVVAEQTYSPYTGGTYTHESALADSVVLFGIDVSKWQGEIDWQAVAADGIKFAFIRCGYSGTADPFHVVEDTRFQENIQGAYDAGIAVGIYYFSQAMTPEEAKQEAEKTIELLAPYADKITLPVVFDLEKVSGSRAKDLSAKDATDAALVWLQMVQEAGYTAYYYGSTGVLGDLFDLSRLGDYGCWVARYNYATKSALTYDFWQYAATGKVNGIANAVDCDFYYYNSDTDELGAMGAVTVTAKDENALVLSWDAVPGATHYQVCRSETSGSGYARIATVTAEDLSYQDSTVSAGMTYYYKVRAYGTSGYLPQYSAYSEEVSGTVGEAENNGAGSQPTSSTMKTTAALNLRSGAGTSYSVVTVMPSGAAVTVLEKTSDTWYKVSYTSKGTMWTGYASAKYLKEDSAATENPGETGNTGSGNTGSTGTETAKTTGTLYLRSGAGTSYSVVTVLPSSAAVTVLEKTNSTWYKVSYTSKGTTWTGYASAKYLKEDSAATENPGETGNTGSGNTGSTGTETAKTTGTLYLRSGAGTSYSALAVMPKGATVKVLEKTNSTWYKVSYTNSKGTTYTGYASAKYLKEDSAATENPGETGNTGSGNTGSTATETAKTTAALNLRSGAGTSYSALAVMPKGATVKVLEKTNSTWYKVSYTNSKGTTYTGYASAKYLTSSTASGSGNTGAGNTGSTGTETAKTTGTLYLRSGAGTSYSVLAVMPKGATVTVLEKTNSTWYKVSYTNSKGTTYTGYASTKYLTSSAASGSGNTGSGNTGSTATETAKTTAALNLRSGAGTSYSALAVMPKGATVTVLEKTNSTWYKVSYTNSKGTTYTGYASAKYLTSNAASNSGNTGSGNTGSTGTETAKTTAALNLRSGAGTSYSALAVMPKGATVKVLEKTNSTWYKVSYTNSKGTTYTGYASAKYLTSSTASGSGNTGSGNTGSTGTETAKTTGTLYLRSGAGTSYSALAVMPKGATVKVLEKTNSTWYKVSYTNSKGTTYTGYTSAKYLK